MTAMIDEADALAVQLANANAEIDALRRRLFEMNGYRTAYEHLLREQSRPPISDVGKEERRLRLKSEAALREVQAELERLTVAISAVEDVIAEFRGESSGSPATVPQRLRTLLAREREGPDTSDIDALHVYALRENKQKDAFNRAMTERPELLAPAWDRFRECTLPPHAPADQVGFVQIAFYHGALAVFEIMAKRARSDRHAAANLRAEVCTFVVNLSKSEAS